MSEKEVAETLGLSVSAVRRIEREGLRKLREQGDRCREIQGLIALRRDGLWIRPYWKLTVDVSCCRGG